MEQFKKYQFLKNNRGQGIVEYILLLAVIMSLSIAFYNNKRFKDFIKGSDGLFLTLRKGMSYSYRYGRAYSSDVEFESKMEFNYNSLEHDTYYNKKQNESRFFTGADKYGDL